MRSWARKSFVVNDGGIQVISGRGMIEYAGNVVELGLLDNEFPGTNVVTTTEPKLVLH